MVPKLRILISGWGMIILLFPGLLVAQSWEVVKEQDGIRIFTRQETGKSLKAYKGMATIMAPADKVFSMIEDVNNTDWWDPNLSEIKVLAYEKNKSARYYLVFDSPWPVSDRDLFVNVSVRIDKVKGIYKITAIPLAGSSPEVKDRVRIRDYRQTWSITSAGENLTHVVIEGYVDPDGNIPVLFANLLSVQSPYQAILGVKQRLERK
jgi:hypothetical protein